MAVLISLIEVIISECIYVSEHQVVHLKYIQFLFVGYNSMKLKKETPKAAGGYRIQSSLNSIGLDQRRSVVPLTRRDQGCDVRMRKRSEGQSV